MATIYDVDVTELIEEAAKELEKMPELAPLVWAAYVKTGRHKERPPIRNDWWHLRTASVLKTVYKLGPIGVSKLRKLYGGRKNRGMSPDRTYMGSGSILRKILQNLEVVGYIKQDERGVHKGRVITGDGRAFLDRIASKLFEPQVKKPSKKIKKAKKEKEVNKTKKKEKTKGAKKKGLKIKKTAKTAGTNERKVKKKSKKVKETKKKSKKVDRAKDTKKKKSIAKGTARKTGINEKKRKVKKKAKKEEKNLKATKKKD